MVAHVRNVPTVCRHYCTKPATTSKQEIFSQQRRQISDLALFPPPQSSSVSHLTRVLPKIVVFPPPAVLWSHDTECAPCEQMKNIPMGAMPPENAGQKQFYKEKTHKWVNVSTESDASAWKCRKQIWRWREPPGRPNTSRYRDRTRRPLAAAGGSDCTCLHVNHFHNKRHHLSLVVGTGPASISRVAVITPDPPFTTTQILMFTSVWWKNSLNRTDDAAASGPPMERGIILHDM